jgi:hypothetical protein
MCRKLKCRRCGWGLGLDVDKPIIAIPSIIKPMDKKTVLTKFNMHKS